MPKRRKNRKIGGKKSGLSFQHGHKPVALLKSFHSKMLRNVEKLERLIHKREAAGE
jgi:galactose-1-phosphate uridylyltransferase